jgi:Right handed beta helix region
MKNTITVLGIKICLMSALVAPCGLVGLFAQTFYVSPKGNDAFVGTVSKPFATVEKAVAAAQKTDKPATIILRSGRYELAKPIQIQRSNLTIKAFEYENPVISGGKTLKSTWQSAGKGRWKTQVPVYFRQLFVNEKRATRARFPNAGQWTDQWFQPDTIQINAKRLVLNKSFPAHFADIKNAEMHATAWWHWLRQKVARFDPEHRAIYTLTEPSPECSGRKMDFVDRIHFENNLAFLDTEGEWFLDELTKTLYYQSVQKPENQTFIYPIAERLIELNGTAEKPITNVKVEGITFTNTEWNMPISERKGIQGGFWGSENGKPVFAPPAAIMAFWSSDCQFQNCHFSNLGEGAIALGDGCRRNRIEDNFFYDIGSNVIQIGWRTNYVGKGKRNDFGGGTDHPLYFNYETEAATPSHNIVHNNHLNKFCTTDLGGVGIWVGYSPHNQLTHNLLEDFSYSGISVGWRWDTLPNSTHHNLIEWNEVRNGMQYLSDGGGIYTAGRQEGTRILNNWVHGIGGGPVLGEGIYNDEGGSYFELAFNHIERIKSLSYKFHKNIFNTINAHDNNGINGQQEVVFPERAAVGSIKVKDSSPLKQENYGLLKKQ